MRVADDCNYRWPTSTLSVAEQQPKYIKINSGGYTYYVRDEFLSSLIQDLLTAYCSATTTLRFSDFVIHNSTNKVVKCRSNIEDIFDCYTGN